MGTNTVIDKVGNELKVGDTVAVPFKQRTHAELFVGTIERFTPSLTSECFVTVEIPTITPGIFRKQAYLPKEIVKVVTKENL
jgi:hypothetical protein